MDREQINKPSLNLREAKVSDLTDYTVSEIRQAVADAGWTFAYMWETGRAELIKRVTEFINEEAARKGTPMRLIQSVRKFTKAEYINEIIGDIESRSRRWQRGTSDKEYLIMDLEYINEKTKTLTEVIESTKEEYWL